MPEQNQRKVKTVKAVHASAAKEAAPLQAKQDRQTQQVQQAQAAPNVSQPDQALRSSTVLSYADLDYHAPQRERRWVSESRKKPFYSQWWFWLAVALLVLIIAILLGLL